MERCDSNFIRVGGTSRNDTALFATFDLFGSNQRKALSCIDGTKKSWILCLEEVKEMNLLFRRFKVTLPYRQQSARFQVYEVKRAIIKRGHREDARLFEVDLPDQAASHMLVKTACKVGIE